MEREHTLVRSGIRRFEHIVPFGWWLSWKSRKIWNTAGPVIFNGNAAAEPKGLVTLESVREAS